MKKKALNAAALVWGCWPGWVMLMATPITSTQPSNETISKRIRREARKLSKVNVVEGDGLDQTLGTGKENALESPKTLLSYSPTQSDNPCTLPSLQRFIRPAKMLRPHTAKGTM